MPEFYFFNTLTRQQESFSPLQPNFVRIYSCGPTVYSAPTIGNLRAYIFTDILRRSLEFTGYKVQHVINITDVGHLISDADEGEDKLEKTAQKSVEPDPLKIARRFEKAFLANLTELNIKKPDYLPRASEHISEQIALIKLLQKNGLTYELADGIYFDTRKFPAYGELSGQKLEEKKVGARVKNAAGKRQSADFALWKFCVGIHFNHILRWDFTGQKLALTETNFSEAEIRHRKIGFPGWHLECSAMSLKYLTPDLQAKSAQACFDIHTGGIDHIPIHHENERAQTEAAYQQKFVNYWLHNEFLVVEGKKMSKSRGNLFTLNELKKRGFATLAFRYFCLETNYRRKINFTWQALTSAAQALTKLRAIYQALPSDGLPLRSALAEFTANLTEDLNLPRALATAWKLAQAERIAPEVRGATLQKFDEVLGLNLACPAQPLELSSTVNKLLAERKAARAQRDFKRADEIRAELLKMNLAIEDTPEGPVVHRKISA